MNNRFLKGLGAAAGAVALIAACTGSPAGSPGSSAAAGGAASDPGGQPSAAGGQAASGGGSGSAVSACSLLTAAEIQGVIGVPMKDGAPQTGNDEQSICNWDSQDDSQSITVGVIVQPYDDSLWTTMSSASAATAVSGLGEAAYKGYPHAGDLAIKQKGHEIDIAIVDFKDAQPKVDAADLALAKLVLSRV
jgi:hypothetical protein